eukprot:2568880-Amphidinium_carterae.1
MKDNLGHSGLAKAPFRGLNPTHTCFNSGLLTSTRLLELHWQPSHARQTAVPGNAIVNGSPARHSYGNPSTLERLRASMALRFIYDVPAEL